MTWTLGNYVWLEREYKVGDKLTYDTPLSGHGKYEAEVLEIKDNIYRVKILRVIQPSQNLLGRQIGDIDYLNPMERK